jgi:carbon storage regulator
MLVLTRKSGQQVIIDQNIIVTVVAIAGNRVRIGFEAPRTVPVLRAELAARLPAHLSDADSRRGIQGGSLVLDDTDL